MEKYAANHESINWAKQEYRLVQDDDGDHWFVIRADEVAVFTHWCAAMRGQRHFPQDFSPVQVDGPHTVVFTGWREDSPS